MQDAVAVWVVRQGHHCLRCTKIELDVQPHAAMHLIRAAKQRSANGLPARKPSCVAEGVVASTYLERCVRHVCRDCLGTSPMS